MLRPMALLEEPLLRFLFLPFQKLLQLEVLVEEEVLAAALVAAEEEAVEVNPLLRNVLPAPISVKYGTHSVIPTKH